MELTVSFLLVQWQCCRQRTLVLLCSVHRCVLLISQWTASFSLRSCPRAVVMQHNHVDLQFLHNFFLTVDDKAEIFNEVFNTTSSISVTSSIWLSQSKQVKRHFEIVETIEIFNWLFNSLPAMTRKKNDITSTSGMKTCYSLIPSQELAVCRQIPQ